jgi:hypothetical protein
MSNKIDQELLGKLSTSIKLRDYSCSHRATKMCVNQSSSYDFHGAEVYLLLGKIIVKIENVFCVQKTSVLCREHRVGQTLLRWNEYIWIVDAKCNIIVPYVVYTFVWFE